MVDQFGGYPVPHFLDKPILDAHNWDARLDSLQEVWIRQLACASEWQQVFGQMDLDGPTFHIEMTSHSLLDPARKIDRVNGFFLKGLQIGRIQFISFIGTEDGTHSLFACHFAIELDVFVCLSPAIVAGSMSERLYPRRKELLES
jgi:hypothetical protein